MKAGVSSSTTHHKPFPDTSCSHQAATVCLSVPSRKRNLKEEKVSGKTPSPKRYLTTEK